MERKANVSENVGGESSRAKSKNTRAWAKSKNTRAKSKEQEHKGNEQEQGARARAKTCFMKKFVPQDT